MAVLHKLQTGLDVNVKFTGVRVFEYTPECIVFDLLDIPLYHGWLVDPQVRPFPHTHISMDGIFHHLPVLTNFLDIVAGKTPRCQSFTSALVNVPAPFLHVFPDARHREGSGQLQLQPAGGEDHFLQAVGQQRVGGRR